ncbi:MAG: NAD-glutamate dehydrogenase [Ilumatobacter sp.]|nr:NAD-glutamate dehydrogenase [Ilumatobacter sp.]
MDTQHDAADVLASLADMARQRRPNDPVLAEFLPRYFRELPDDDVEERGLDEVYAAGVTHFALGAHREPGEVQVKVQSPDLERDGWQSDLSVLMFVTDDLPFLVDTVRLVLDRHEIGIRLLVHPMLAAVRDDEHRLVGFEDSADPSLLEAWTQVQLDRCTTDLERVIEADVHTAIADVARVVHDFPEMRRRMIESSGDDPLLAWLADPHFVFLGAASYDRVVDGDGVPTLTVQAGSELGELRPDARLDASDPEPPSKPGNDPADDVVIARTDAVATIHRASRMTSIAIREQGGAVEHRFVGLLGSGSYRESVFAIPTLRERANEVLDLYGANVESYTGRAIKNVVETLPRDLVFELDAHSLAELVIDIVGLQERRIVRVFDVAEPVGPFTTVLVYVPKVRFDSEMSDRVATLVAQAYDSEVRDVSSLLGASSLARISMTVRAAERVDLDRLADVIDAATASWDDRARVALTELYGDVEGRRMFQTMRDCIPNDYRARVNPALSAGDLSRVASLVDTDPDSHGALTTSLVRSVDDAAGHWRFRVFRRGEPATIAELVPQLNHLGLHALDERPYVFTCPGTPVHLYDIGVRFDMLGDGDEFDEGRHAEVQHAFRSLLRGEIEADGLNRLVLAADLTVRQVAVLRCYSRYLQQASFPFSQSYIEQALVRHAPIAHGLAELFDARFDPHGEPPPSATSVVVNAIRSDIIARLDAIPSLDEDRICRGFLTLIDATTRTNAFRRRPDGALPDEIAVKLDPRQIPFLPEPRPMFEIFVCSPKVEGVHLRAGRVARGGLRWSDRPEDFRTEVLGLVKAQMVKNAVIVPVGAKGGFVVKQAAASPTDRDAIRAEGVDRYERFMRSLLDVTDNLVAGDGAMVVQHPSESVIYDDDDPYLVVAADKGTATFSDIANAVAAEYGFWLGDAFASGGSVGYDHKAMGITARGAWESVRRHASVLGKDVDTDTLTVVGVGDMSGDVFGNGMLLSEHLKLVAAFDHRHVFLDPDPDPAASHAERKRLFELPRSSWADYDESLISAGGGVYPRTLKSIPVSPEVRGALGLDADVTEMRPDEILSAVLMAPVDLLWNGGIGTYVKATTETHESVGDRANDSIRVDAVQLRCKIVGEGGNLGFTQLARVEYAVAGGLIYTDAIDNSAGVDCSDHEVNIKIALAQLIAEGEMTEKQRNQLLVEMTDEVAELVLDDNRAQTLALMITRRQSLSMVNVHARYLDALESEGHIDRALEDLPNDKQIAERQSAGSGLRTPEFAVMIASTKNADIDEIMATDLPDDPALEPDLFAYFPTPIQERYPQVIRTHRLRREIITTGLVNNMVNLSGISFDHRMTEQSGASVADVARAFVASRNILGFNELWNEIDDLGTSVDLDTLIDLFLDARRMAERGTSWLLRRRAAPLDITDAVDTFGAGLGFLCASLDEVIAGRVARDVTRLRERRIAANVPEDLAARSARWPWLHAGFDIVELAHEQSCNVGDAAVAYWAVFEAFDIGWLWDGIGGLPRSDRWQTQARASLRDDLMMVLASLAGNVIRTADGSPAAWIAANERAVSRVIAMETEIRRAEAFDLTTLSVALRQLRNLTVTAVARPDNTDGLTRT